MDWGILIIPAMVLVMLSCMLLSGYTSHQWPFSSQWPNTRQKSTSTSQSSLSAESTPDDPETIFCDKPGQESSDSSNLNG